MAGTDRADRPDGAELQRWYAQEAAEMPDGLVAPPSEAEEADRAEDASGWPGGWWILPVILVSAILWTGLLSAAFG